MEGSSPTKAAEAKVVIPPRLHIPIPTVPAEKHAELARLLEIPEEEWKFELFLNTKDNPEVLYQETDKCGEGYASFMG